MRARAVLLLLLAVAACQRPPPAPREPAGVAPAPAAPAGDGLPTSGATAADARVDPPLGDLERVASFPAWDAVLAGDRVVVIDPGFHSLSGYDAATGERRWRTSFPERPSGRQSLSLRGRAVIFWGGDRLRRVDTATGALLSTESVPWNGDCARVEEGGVCGFSCSCSFSLADCESGRPIGRAHRKTYVEIMNPNGGWSSGCYARGVGLLGGGGGMAVVRLEDMKDPSPGIGGRAKVVVGLDARTGDERWRSAAIGEIGWGWSGAAAGRGYVASRDGALRVFDVRTGKPAWQIPAAAGEPPRVFFQVDEARGTILRQVGSEATGFSLASGKRLWRAAIPPHGWAVLRGVRVPRYEVDAGDRSGAVVVLDPVTGAERGRADLPARSTAYDDPAGGFYVLGASLVAHDAGGRERARIAVADPPNLQVGLDFAALYGGERWVFLDRRDLRVVGALGGSISVQPGSSLAGGLLVYRHARERTQPGEALLLRRKGRAPAPPSK